ncbi:MAG TPA: nucleotidyl transferase AbiEii/AbiGii toxin family protein [Thermoleophilaceae bacterium]|nr:nucleotidyl transferase AbiEii/AbiGii toxin family protein [Thermoleophilaceae bacterium]
MGDDERFEPDEILAALNEHGVQYVVVGGFAIAAHGVVRATADLDLVVQLDWDNAAALAAALTTIEARDLDDSRSAISQESLVRSADRRLRTRHGEVRLLNEADGVPRYEELVPAAVIELDGQRVPVAQLELDALEADN